MRKHVVLNSPRLKEIRRKKHKSTRKKVTIFLVIFLIILLGLSFASRMPAFNIKIVDISGNKVIDTKDILEIVQNEIYSDYLWIFPKTNFLIYPQDKIEKELKNKFKRIKNITVNDKNINTLEVKIEEYEGKYLWCGVLIPALRSNSEDKKCYFLDGSGYVFDEAPYFSGNVYFKFYGNNGINEGSPIGSYFTKDKFEKIVEFKNTIEKMNLKLTAFWIDGNNPEEGNFAIRGEPGISPRITFKLDGDYEKLAENLQAAISTEPLRTDIKTKLSSLLYLDLRFGNKVFYKFQ